MPNQNSLENLFNLMKSLGNFPEYADYQSYREKKLGITSQEDNEKEFESWKENLPESEQLDFDQIFGE